MDSVEPPTLVESPDRHERNLKNNSGREAYQIPIRGIRVVNTEP